MLKLGDAALCTMSAGDNGQRGQKKCSTAKM